MINQERQYGLYIDTRSYERQYHLPSQRSKLRDITVVTQFEIAVMYIMVIARPVER